VQRLRNVVDAKSVEYLGERKMIDLSLATDREASKPGN
jgi:hypothetical protein